MIFNALLSLMRFYLFRACVAESLRFSVFTVNTMDFNAPVLVCFCNSVWDLFILHINLMLLSYVFNIKESEQSV